MPVRALRPSDMVALASLRRTAENSEITAHTWPVVEPGSARIPYLTLVSNALTRSIVGKRAWVAESAGNPLGYVTARPRAGGLVWDVTHLHAAPGADEVAVDLLERVASAATSRSVRRVFLETPSD